METNKELVFPQLQGFYALLERLALPLLRVVSGVSLFVHGWYIVTHIQETADWLAGEGYPHAMLFTWIIMLIQTLGGVALAFGILTRLAAIPIFLFLVNAIFYHAKNGYFWNFNGLEYPLMWSIVVALFFAKGGGDYSVDALFRKQL
jgi:putative oxidoreductase